MKVKVKVVDKSDEWVYKIFVTKPEAVFTKIFEDDLFYEFVLKPVVDRWFKSHEGVTPSA